MTPGPESSPKINKTPETEILEEEQPVNGAMSRRDFIINAAATATVVAAEGALSGGAQAVEAGVEGLSDQEKADAESEADIEARERELAVRFSASFSTLMVDQDVLNLEEGQMYKVVSEGLITVAEELEIHVPPNELAHWLFNRGQFFHGGAWYDRGPWFSEIIDVDEFNLTQEPTVQTFVDSGDVQSVPMATINNELISDDGVTTPDGRIFLNLASIKKTTAFFNSYFAEYGISIDESTRTQMVRLNEAWHVVFQSLYPELRHPQRYDQPIDHPVATSGERKFTARHIDEFLSDCIVLSYSPHKLPYMLDNLGFNLAIAGSGEMVLQENQSNYAMQMQLLFDGLNTMLADRGGIGGVLKDANVIVNNSWNVESTMDVARAIYGVLSEAERRDLRETILEKGEELKKALGEM